MKEFLLFILIYLTLGLISAALMSRHPSWFDETEPSYHEPGGKTDAGMVVLAWWFVWLVLLVMWLQKKAWNQFSNLCSWICYPHKPKPESKPEPWQYCVHWVDQTKYHCEECDGDPR